MEVMACPCAFRRHGQIQHSSVITLHPDVVLRRSVPGLTISPPDTNAPLSTASASRFSPQRQRMLMDTNAAQLPGYWMP